MFVANQSESIFSHCTTALVLSLSALGKLGVSQFSLSWSQAGKGGASRLSAGRQSSLELLVSLLGGDLPLVPSSELPDDAENKVDWLVGTRGISFCDTGQCD